MQASGGHVGWLADVEQAAIAAQRRAAERVGVVLAERAEISFDAMLPFLLDNDWSSDPQWAAELLIVARAVAEAQVERNQRRERQLLSFLRRWELGGQAPALSWQSNRSLRWSRGNDIRCQYLRSTRRVSYRFTVIRHLGREQQTREAVKAVRVISAFLLFDDDLVDLEADRQIGKETLLTISRREGLRLPVAIQGMVNLVRVTINARDHGAAMMEFATRLLKLYIQHFDVGGEKG